MVLFLCARAMKEVGVLVSGGGIFFRSRRGVDIFSKVCIIFRAVELRAPVNCDDDFWPKTPEFVTRHIRADIDWDKNVKEAPYVPPKEFKPWESALPAVETKSKVKDRKPDLTIVKQVPQSITSAPPSSKPVVKDKTQYTDHAISWSKMYKDADVQNTIGKRPRPEDDDEDLAGFCHTDLDGQKVAFQVKHQKTAIKAVTFRDKEKRKRDSGQANREKMFVEEEKRILRQNFDG